MQKTFIFFLSCNVHVALKVLISSLTNGYSGSEICCLLVQCRGEEYVFNLHRIQQNEREFDEGSCTALERIVRSGRPQTNTSPKM